MILKFFIKSTSLAIEDQGSATPRLLLDSDVSDDNFVGTIYFGRWLKGDRGEPGPVQDLTEIWQAVNSKVIIRKW